MNDKIHFVGRLDREIFKVVAEDIQTDEVIITEERIAHIKKNHPNNFEEIQPFLKMALIAPDYILEDDENIKTGLILKDISEHGLKFKVVLRLHTSSDPQEYKNSIISAWKISNSRWENYIKNKKYFTNANKCVIINIG